MSFHKMNICRSTEVALNVFYLFKNNLVNMVHTQEGPVVQQVDDETDPKIFEKISILLQRGKNLEIIAHNIVETSSYQTDTMTRLVEFVVKEDRFSEEKTIFSIIVSCSSFENCGFGEWQMDEVSIRSVRYGVQKNYQFVVGARPWGLLEYIEENAGGLISLKEEEEV